MFDELAAGERSVNELVRRTGLSQPGVSQHLRVLRAAGLVRARPVAQRRLYSVDPTGFRVIELWLERTRRRLAAQLDSLERHLDRQKEDGG